MRNIEKLRYLPKDSVNLSDRSFSIGLFLPVAINCIEKASKCGISLFLGQLTLL